ncbi:MAG: GNAT family N-acetyltransferase [Lachnospiraceae bacterium]|nr:GNAT family N-acetyltransferase [Lachnospiraceae bacterium]
MNTELAVREVQTTDAERLVEIYSYFVKNTAVSFEYMVPSAAEFEKRIIKIKEKYPYLVCTADGRLTGYAYAGRYNTREAYNWTVTTSIYVDREYRRQGIGSFLYDELEKRLKEQGIVNLLAAVAFSEKEDEYLSHDSIRFHLSRGYEQVAHMRSVGKKFDRWYDLLWFQKKL